MSLGSNTVTDTWMASNTLCTPSGPSKKSSAGQPLVARELVRQGQVNLAGELRFPPRLNLVHVVPEPLPIGDPGRGPSGSMISVCTTPLRRLKSCLAPACSSCSRSPARYPSSHEIRGRRATTSYPTALCAVTKPLRRAVGGLWRLNRHAVGSAVQNAS